MMRLFGKQKQKQKDECCNNHSTLLNELLCLNRQIDELSDRANVLKDAKQEIIKKFDVPRGGAVLVKAQGDEWALTKGTFEIEIHRITRIY